MPSIGMPELLVILVIVILLFGANRITGVAGALGTSIKEFKRALRDDESTAAKLDNTEKHDHPV